VRDFYTSTHYLLTIYYATSQNWCIGS
jgi:hypothetical protein